MHAWFLLPCPKRKEEGQILWAKRSLLSLVQDVQCRKEAIFNSLKAHTLCSSWLEPRERVHGGSPSWKENPWCCLKYFQAILQRRLILLVYLYSGSVFCSRIQ